MAASKASIIFGFFAGQASAGSWGFAWPWLGNLNDPSMPVVGHSQLPWMSRGDRRLQPPLVPYECEAACNGASDYVQKLIAIKSSHAGSGGVPSSESQAAMMDEMYTLACEYQDIVTCLSENNLVCRQSVDVGGLDLMCFCKSGYLKALAESAKYRDDPMKANCAIITSQLAMLDVPECEITATKMKTDSGQSLAMLKSSYQTHAEHCEHDGACDAIVKEYKTQGCCGNPGKPFSMPKHRRLQAQNVSQMLFCSDAKAAYKQMQCCSKATAVVKATSGGSRSTYYVRASQEQVKQIYLMSDKDQNGLLSMEEFLNASVAAAGFPDADAMAVALGVSKEAILQSAAEAYGRVDANEDGIVSTDEVAMYLEAAGRGSKRSPVLTSEESTELLLNGDRDQDGVMSMDEFLAVIAIVYGFADADAMAAQDGLLSQMAAGLYDQLDANGDSTVTMEEVKNAI